MNLSTTAKDVLRVATTAGLSKDVIDLLTVKVTLLDEKLIEANLSLEQARIKIAELIAENKELRKKLNDSAKVEERLNPKEEQVLRFFFDAARELSYADIVREFQWTKGESDHFISELVVGGYLDRIRPGTTSGPRGSTPPMYRITHKGSSHIMKNG